MKQMLIIGNATELTLGAMGDVIEMYNPRPNWMC